MSAFGRDLIGNVNCGTANPLMQMAGQMQGMGAQLADVRSFGGAADKQSAMPLRPAMSPADLMRAPSLQTGDASHFMPGFQPQQMNRPNAMPLHVQQQQQAARQQQLAMQRMPAQAQQPQMPNGLELADQFHQMELQNKQFESAFQAAQAAMPGNQEMWANEFQIHQQQQQQQRMMHQQSARPMHHQPQQMSYGSGYGGMDMMRSRMMGMGFGGMNAGMGYGMQQAYASSMSASSIPAPATAKVAEMPANVTEEEFDGLYSTRRAQGGESSAGMEGCYWAKIGVSSRTLGMNKLKCSGPEIQHGGWNGS